MQKMPKTDKNHLSRLAIVGGIVFIILILDQIIKVWVKLRFSNDPGGGFNILGNWFVLEYIENQGMAFGTTFGSQVWHKLALSIFRLAAITGMVIYLFKQASKGAKLEFLIVVGLILAGATGNLIDSMVYDFFFTYDPCMGFNHLAGSGIKTDCGIFGVIETRHTGFLMGNVVDMFKFQALWPQWIPLVGGREVFPAIWNVADASISVGVVTMLIRQRTYFPKEKKVEGAD
jgi:signal peptidase II